MGLQEDEPERPGLQGPSEACPVSGGTSDLLRLCSHGGGAVGPVRLPRAPELGREGLRPRQRELNCPWAREVAPQSRLREAWLPPRGRPPEQPCLDPVGSPTCRLPAPLVPGCGPARHRARPLLGDHSRWPAGDPTGPGGRTWGHGAAPCMVGLRPAVWAALPSPAPAPETRMGTGGLAQPTARGLTSGQVHAQHGLTVPLVWPPGRGWTRTKCPSGRETALLRSHLTPGQPQSSSGAAVCPASTAGPSTPTSKGRPKDR